MKFYYLFLVIVVTGCTTQLYGQRSVRLTLPETVSLAQGEAPSSLIAKTRLTNNYWNYTFFQSNFRPQLSLNATLPSLDRSIIQFIEGGVPTFVPQTSLSNFIGATITQQIGATGGTVSAGTQLQRFDIFEPEQFTSYLSNPFFVRFNQPLFNFNALKWDKILFPLEYQEAKREYSEDMEAIALESANLFFDVYIAQLRLEAAEKDKANADTLYRISQGRFSVGKIAETELLQVEIARMNADAAVASSTLNLQSSTEELRNYLGIKDIVTFDLVPPTDIPEFTIDAEKALTNAKANRSAIIAFERRLKEAERSVERSIKGTGFSMNLNANFGITQNAEKFGEVYQNVQDQERISIGLQVPLMDWGRREAQRQIAASNQELVQMRVEQDRISFERDIILKVQQFDLVRTQTKLALRNYEVAQKSYDLTQKRYLIGKIGITDINLAQTNLERSRTAYMNALRLFWIAYYDIRRVTLYDFENNKSLRRDAVKVIEDN